jgi:hypothetical protein
LDMLIRMTNLKMMALIPRSDPNYIKITFLAWNHV